MKPIDFFKKPQTIAQKQYEALRMFFVDKVDARTVADTFGYTYRGFTTIVSDFRIKLRNNEVDGLFFNELKRGRKKSSESYQDMIISLRKKYYSVMMLIFFALYFFISDLFSCGKNIVE